MVLVDHERPNVFITAAWGLKVLAMDAWAKDIEAIMRKLGTEPANVGDPDQSQKLTHLIEAMGRLRHRGAIDFLETLVPKAAPYRPWCRVAAVWALGCICEAERDPEIVQQMRGRVSDTAAPPAEFDGVRAHAGAALGRMGATDSADFLREWIEEESPDSWIGRYCAWGIFQLDGTPVPPVRDIRRAISGWSLRPTGGR
jgi:hypothetical protein